MPMTPTQLSLRHLRDDGWTAEVVERWNEHARIRQDFLGIIDIIALRGPETLGVQCTSVTNVSNHLRKMADSPHIAALREAGWTLRCWGWKKDKNRWVLARDVDVS